MTANYKIVCLTFLLITAGWMLVPDTVAQNAINYQQLKENFINPDYATWGEVPLWWWEGDSLQKERVTWQLETLASKGDGARSCWYNSQSVMAFRRTHFCIIQSGSFAEGEQEDVSHCNAFHSF